MRASIRFPRIWFVRPGRRDDRAGSTVVVIAPRVRLAKRGEKSRSAPTSEEMRRSRQTLSTQCPLWHGAKYLKDARISKRALLARISGALGTRPACYATAAPASALFTESRNRRRRRTEGTVRPALDSSAPVSLSPVIKSAEPIKRAAACPHRA